MSFDPTIDPSSPDTPPNHWAVASLWIGVVSFVLSFTLYIPVPITIPISCPGGVIAWITGAIGLYLAHQQAQPTAKRQAQWGIGLGCATYIVLLALVAAGIGIAAFGGISLINQWVN